MRAVCEIIYTNKLINKILQLFYIENKITFYKT